MVPNHTRIGALHAQGQRGRRGQAGRFELTAEMLDAQRVLAAPRRSPWQR